MRNRQIGLESLEGRRLLTGDDGGISVNQSIMPDTSIQDARANSDAQLNRIRVTSELASAFATSMQRVIDLNEFLVAVGRRQISSFALENHAHLLVGAFAFDKPISEVVPLDPERLIVTTTRRVDDVSIQMETSVSLLQISDSGDWTLIDKLDRPMGLVGISMAGDLLSLTWDHPGNDLDSTTALDGAPDLRLEHPTQTWLHYWTEYIDLSNLRLDQELTVETLGGVSGHYLGDGRYISLIANEIHLWSRSATLENSIDLAPYGDVLSIQAASFLESESAYSVVATTWNAAFGQRQFLFTIALDGQLVDAEVLQTGFHAMEAIVGIDALPYTHASIKSLYNNGLAERTTAYPLPNSGDLVIVTETDGELDLQQVSLPFHRVGFRPAFVLDENTIVTVRADLTALEASNFTADDSAIRYTAHLLRRDRTGSFQAVDQRELPSIDFEASAAVTPHAVTFRDQVSHQATDEYTIVRVDGDRLLVDITRGESDHLIGTSTGVVAIAEDERVSFIRWNGPKDSSAIAHESTLDVSGDGRVSAIDALLVINQLNRLGALSESTAGEVLSVSGDVNGDGRVSAIDALMVINHLNQKGTFAASPFGDDDDDGRGAGREAEAEARLF
ncbi:MAG: dockerin type I domain-containing protein [Planctomycetota bacterium]